MVNVLVDRLPTAVDVNGEEWPIRPDFRAALRIILAFEDDGLTGTERGLVLLANLYPEIPPDTGAAIEAGLHFLNSGEDDEAVGDGPRLFSFEKDSGLIFAAFRQTHGVDLDESSMHWWKFMALFMDLGADTAFCNLVGLRRRVASGKATKAERETARDMGDAFVVPQPDTRTPEEIAREDHFMATVRAAMEKRRNGST